jgi:hypothetical protein
VTPLSVRREGGVGETAFLARMGLAFTDRFALARGFVDRTVAGRFPRCPLGPAVLALLRFLAASRVGAGREAGDRLLAGLAGTPSRRASRYFLILALGTPRLVPQTMPKTGAATFLHPGTGHNCFGRGAARDTLVNVGVFGGRPGPRLGAASKALSSVARSRCEDTC